MVKHKDGSWERTTLECNSSELKEMLYFYRETHREVATPDLLNLSGFKNNRLQAVCGADLRSPRHTLLWSDKVQWGMCSCLKWEQHGKPIEYTRIQHTTHARKVG